MSNQTTESPVTLLQLIKPGSPCHDYGKGSSLIGKSLTTIKAWQGVPAGTKVTLTDLNLSPGHYGATVEHQGKKIGFPSDYLIETPEKIKTDNDHDAKCLWPRRNCTCQRRVKHMSNQIKGTEVTSLIPHPIKP